MEIFNIDGATFNEVVDGEIICKIFTILSEKNTNI